MLVLTRKTDEQIMIGDEIKITLVQIRGNRVRLGIEAPRDVRVVRSELTVAKQDQAGEDQAGEVVLEICEQSTDSHRSGEVHVGRIRMAARRGVSVPGTTKRAPLAAFVSAT